MNNLAGADLPCLKVVVAVAAGSIIGGVVLSPDLKLLCMGWLNVAAQNFLTSWTGRRKDAAAGRRNNFEALKGFFEILNK